MRKLLLVFLVLPVYCLAQQQTFDITTYSAPKAWKSQSSESTIQFSTEDEAKGSYCLIMLFKSLPGMADSKANFDAAWETVVKEAVTVSSPPEMQPAAIENGWEALTGYAPFESNGSKGVVMLLTSTGYEKMINILILTNSDIYEKDISDFLGSLHFKQLSAPSNKPATDPSKIATPNTVTKKDGFAFNTTHFDDGWTSTVQEDWVEVTKGSIKVLLHYPNKKADVYNSVLKEGDYNAWNTLVAQRYSNMKNFEWRTIQSYESISFVEADATEIKSGKTVHIVLFKKHYSNGNGRYLEFVTDSKAAYEYEFGAYHSTSYDWDKPANMQFRNKFSVAANDLIGTWTTSDYASVSYYYVNSGGLAGTSTTSTADEFTFSSGNNYQSQHSGASGEVGNIKFSNQVYKGKSSVSNWSITLTNRFHGATENYDCNFEAIKGGRILLMTDRLKTTRALVKK